MRVALRRRDLGAAGASHVGAGQARSASEGGELLACTLNGAKRARGGGHGGPGQMERRERPLGTSWRGCRGD